MNLFAIMLERVRDAASRLAEAAALPSSLDIARVTVEPPFDLAHGDMTTNAPLVLADAAGRPPHEFAVALAEMLRTNPLVERTEVGGPGFVNMTLRPDTWTGYLRDLLTEHTHVEARVSSKFSYFESFPKSKYDTEIAPDWVTTAFCVQGAATFTAAQITEQAYANPLFNTRYAHARARAIYRRARESFADRPEASEERRALLRDAALERLLEPSESTLLRQIARYPYVLEVAAAQRQPHHLGAYLNGLASTFHAQLRHGMVTPYLRSNNLDDRELTVARLALVEAVVIVLGTGLAELGFEAPEEIT